MKLIIFVSFLICELASATGVVTGGGGGVINPRQADPSDVSRAISQWGGLVIESWFQRIRMEFDVMDSRAQSLSPFKKVFSPNFNFVKVFRNTSVEVRFREPCYNSQGHPFDGSVFSRYQGAVCISAFTTAPKLTPYNVEPETLALLAHEYSHLAGCDETEAQAIQMRALDHFHRVKFDGLQRQLRAILSSFGYSENRISVNRVIPSNGLNYPLLWHGSLTLISGFSKLISDDGHFAFASASGIRNAQVIKALLITANIVSCTLDSSAPAITQDECRRELSAIFRNRSSASIREVLAIGGSDQFCSTFSSFCYSGSDYDVLISKPQNQSDLEELLKGIHSSTSELGNDVLGLATRGVVTISD